MRPYANVLQEVRNNMMGYDVKEVHQKLGVGISLSEDELQKYSEFLIRVDQDYVNFVNKKMVTVESEGWWNELNEIN